MHPCALPHEPDQVLVVEDDPVVRLSLAGLLRRRTGFAVVEAADGQEAWEMLESGKVRPALCCADIMMPRLDGLELMARMRAHPVLAHLPVIVITAASDRATVQGAIRQRAAGFMVKPIVGADAVAAVERVIRETRWRRAEQPAASCARLDLDGPALAQALEGLRLQADRLHADAASGCAATHLADQAGRLRSACKMLGLWHAATLLRAPLEQSLPWEQSLAVLREVACIVHVQQALAEAMPPPVVTLEMVAAARARA